MTLKNLAAILLVSMGFQSYQARADYDLRVDGLMRTYPAVFAMTTQMAYGQLLWGQTPGQGPERNIKYGYIRVGLDGAVAFTTNGVGAFVDIHPISFLGFKAGTDYSRTSADNKSYDCVAYNCQGVRRKKYVESELALGMGPVFWVLRARRDQLTRGEADSRPFVDFWSGLAADADGSDNLTTLNSTIGTSWNEKTKLFYQLSYFQMNDLPGISRSHAVGASYKWNEYSAAVGIGTMGTEILSNQPMMIGRLSWNIAPSLALF